MSSVKASCLAAACTALYTLRQGGWRCREHSVQKPAWHCHSECEEDASTLPRWSSGAKYLTRVSHNHSSWPKGAQEERLFLKHQCALHCFLPTDRWDLHHSQAPLLPRGGPGETFLRCCKQRKLSRPPISEKPVTWILPPPSLVARDVPDRV